MLGELSLDCDALIFRSVEPDAKGRRTRELLGVGVVSPMVTFPNVGFVTLRGSFAELDVLEAFGVVTAV